MITEADERRADRRRWRGYAYTAALLAAGLIFAVITSPELAAGDVTGAQPIDVPVIEFDEARSSGDRGMTTFAVGTERGRRTQIMTALTNDGPVPVRIDEVLVASDLQGRTAPCAWQVEEAFVGRGGDRYTSQTTTTPLGDGVDVGRGETITLRLVGALPAGRCGDASFAALTSVEEFQVRATVAGRSTYRSVPLGLRFAWVDDPSPLRSREGATVHEPRG